MATRPPAPHPTPAASLLPRAAAALTAATAVLAGPVPGALAQSGGVGEPVGGGSGAGLPTTTEATTSSSTGIVLAVVAVVVVLVVVAVVIALVAGRSRRGAPAAVATAPAPASPPAPAAVTATDERATRERDRLVQVLIDVGDQLDSVALAAWVTQALAEVGVAEVVVDGQRFDPSRHQAVEHVATTDPAADGFVARTSTRGFVDRGRVVRPPQVLVYRYQAAS